MFFMCNVVEVIDVESNDLFFTFGFLLRRHKFRCQCLPRWTIEEKKKKMSASSSSSLSEYIL